MKETVTLKFDTDARNHMIEGVKQLSAAVSITLGPKGKNVAIYKHGHRPHLTKDGVTVANSINLKDSFMNLGCQIVKEAAQRSAEVAGDGTTTSTVLAATLLEDGHRLLETGYDSKDVLLGINAACLDVLSALEETRVDLDNSDQLISVATISANGEVFIGKLIADAIEKVGADGPITVENAKGFQTELEIVEGTVVSRGYLSPYFVTNQAKNTAELEKSLVFIYNQTLTNAKTILPILEYAASNNKSLLIIANDVTNEALQTLVLNKMKGAINVCAIKAPEFGAARTQALQDLAAICNAEVVASEALDPTDDLTKTLGYCDKVLVDKQGTLLIGTSGCEDQIQNRINSAKESLSSLAPSNPDIGVFKRRIRRLSEGIAIIRAGGSTEVEMLERKDRIDDALCASRSAKKSGIQPGGGTALVQASKRCIKRKKTGFTEGFNAGYDVFLRSCHAPLIQIVENTGEVSEIILRKIKKSSSSTYGYDARTGTYGDMFDMKIIDPHDVVSSSIIHATSVACNILSIGCAISINEDEQEGDFPLLEDL
jgi:chaperonin GroEL